MLPGEEPHGQVDQLVRDHDGQASAGMAVEAIQPDGQESAAGEGQAGGPLRHGAGDLGGQVLGAAGQEDAHLGGRGKPEPGRDPGESLLGEIEGGAAGRGGPGRVGDAEPAALQAVRLAGEERGDQEEEERRKAAESSTSPARNRMTQ